MSFDRINKSGFDESAIHYNQRYEFDKLPLITGTPVEPMKFMVQSADHGEMKAIYLSDVTHNAIHTNISNEFSSIPEKLVVDSDDMVLLEEITTRDKRKARLSSLGIVQYVNNLPVEQGVTVDWNVIPETTFKFNYVWADDFRDSDGTIAKFSLGLSAENSNIINLGEPINSSDATTKNYIDTKEIQTFPIDSAATINWGPDVELQLGTITITSLRSNDGDHFEIYDDINCRNFQTIFNLKDPLTNLEASNKQYVDNTTNAAIQTANTYTDNKEIQSFPLGSGSINWVTNDLKVKDIYATAIRPNNGLYINIANDIWMISGRIRNVSDPVDNQDATNKQYVDGRVAENRGFIFKTDSAVTLTGSEIVDNSLFISTPNTAISFLIPSLSKPSDNSVYRFSIYFTTTVSFEIRADTGTTIYYEGTSVPNSQKLQDTVDPQNVTIDFVSVYEQTSTTTCSWAITSNSRPLSIVAA